MNKVILVAIFVTLVFYLFRQDREYSSLVLAFECALIALQCVLSDSSPELEATLASACFAVSFMYTLHYYGLGEHNYGVWLWLFPSAFSAFIAQRKKSVFASVLTLSQCLAAFGFDQSSTLMFVMAAAGMLFYKDGKNEQETRTKLANVMYLSCLFNVLFMPESRASDAFFDITHPLVKLSFIVGLKMIYSYVPGHECLLSWTSIRSFIALYCTAGIFNHIFRAGDYRVFVTVLVFYGVFDRIQAFSAYRWIDNMFLVTDSAIEYRDAYEREQRVRIKRTLY